MENSNDNADRKTAIRCIYKIIVNNKEIIQNQYITDKCVYIENAEKKVLFLPQRKKQYTIDTKNEQIKELDLSPQILQMKQIKSLIGEINSRLIIATGQSNDQIKEYHLSNIEISPIKFEGIMRVSEYPGLEKTVYQDFNSFQADLQLYKTPLKANEIVSFLESALTINGNEQKSTLDLLSIIETKEIEEIAIYLGWLEKM
jgi:hypothetical protein